jgi:hypothetical protein
VVVLILLLISFLCCLQLNPLLLCSISSLRRVGVHLTGSYTKFSFPRRISTYEQ